MSLCKFSSEFTLSNQTEVDNIFINDYLPYSPGDAVRVYLYGLYKCNNSDSYDNTLEHFAQVLKMSEDDVYNCFLYWQEQGLVQVLPTKPFEVRYMPVRNAVNGIKKFNKKKYENFNALAQEIISDRMITPTEFAEYYLFLETFKVEHEALIMIMHYATLFKGKTVGYKYILTIAKNWASEGILRAADVEERLKDLENASNDCGVVLKALGIKRAGSIEEKEMLKNWQEEFGFSLETITFVAKELKKKPNASFYKLNETLSAYYQNKLISAQEITSYEKQKDEFFTVAKWLNNKFYLYEKLGYIVDTYVSKWANLGYSFSTIKHIAEFCNTLNKRSLEYMNDSIQKFYKLGLVSEKSINEYLETLIEIDSKIKEVISALGFSRKVIDFDRELYSTWTANWNLSHEIIVYGAQTVKGTINAIKNLNDTLSKWKEKGIKSADEAKNLPKNTYDKPSKTPKGRNYSRDQLNSLFTSIDEIEI